MNGYQLQRRWFDWVFRNPGAVNPAHGGLYLWYVEACNRAEWADMFEMAPQYAMSATGISAYNTYKNYLSDLQTWGFIRIRQKGANQYTPWLLALSNFDEPLNKPNAVALSKIDIPLNKARNKAKSSAVSNFDETLDEAVDTAPNEAVDEACDAITINKKPVNPKPSNPQTQKEGVGKTSLEKAVADAPDAPSAGVDEEGVISVEAEEVIEDDPPPDPDPKRGTGAAKSPKPKEHLFVDSPYYQLPDFLAAFTTPDNAKYQRFDLEHYHEAVRNWADSGSSAKYRKTNWIATARNFMLGDENKGTARYHNQPTNGTGHRKNGRSGPHDRAEFGAELDAVFARQGQYDDSEGAVF